LRVVASVTTLRPVLILRFSSWLALVTVLRRRQPRAAGLPALVVPLALASARVAV
jgi:hypothetical protein